ncbi:siroheme synthase middle domains-like protein [Nadsonia fulvescens var. elongata DSM 6958]|uniref:precorrin-2 dehydrogenase n=1 Tax=Nadsonia fulvescens var. elongata DSM 6958 TaxID=857566 RepID=A0A1E3PKF5_9ASCO|nr:siroheme synthase middle domains-like protein [Nadsonia fulvescens var. elongata DSM 6958]
MSNENNQTEYPEIISGGGLMLAWQVKNKEVLIVGGGSVAAQRIVSLLSADANITLVSPEINDECLFRLKECGGITITNDDSEENQLARLSIKPKTGFHTFIHRGFRESDIHAGFALVFTCVNEPVVSRLAYDTSKKYKIPVNVADVPPLCDFYFGAVWREGSIQVMVSTGGKAPGLARVIRSKIGTALTESEDGEQDGGMVAAVESIGRLRALVKEHIPDVKGRMKFVREICDTWTISEIARMKKNEMIHLIKKYPEVPAYSLIYEETQ